MLANLVRGFCRENNYKMYEKYSGRYMFGRMTIGIIVSENQNYFEMLAQLTSFLEEKLKENEIDEQLLGQLLEELEGVAIDELGLDVIVYFPAIQNYQPLPSEE